VKDQISRRNRDYLEYLQPQSNHADLIVNFCNEGNTSQVDSIKGIGRKLNLFIKEPYAPETILEKFSTMGVLVNINESTKKGYMQLGITNYKKIDKNYYYDYIMVCILDMIKTTL